MMSYMSQYSWSRYHWQDRTCHSLLNLRSRHVAMSILVSKGHTSVPQALIHHNSILAHKKNPRGILNSNMESPSFFFFFFYMHCYMFSAFICAWRLIFNPNSNSGHALLHETLYMHGYMLFASIYICAHTLSIHANTDINHANCVGVCHGYICMHITTG